MTVGNKMARIADRIRELLNISEKLTLDNMSLKLQEVTEEVDIQTNLINEILQKLSKGGE